MSVSWAFCSISMLAINALRSATLEVKGFHKSEKEEDIIDILSAIELPVRVDFLSRYSHRSKIYVTYDSMDSAMRVIHSLHQCHFKDTILSVRYELGMDKDGRRIVDSSSHNTLIRSVRSHKLSDYENTKRPPSNSYSFNSVTIDHTSYPFPSGLYVSRVLGLTRTLPSTDPLLDLLTSSCHCGKGASKQSKELSEVMAMADSTERAIKRVFGVPSAELRTQQVDVYVVGDGKVPLGCACLCLHFPAHWHFHSIDPLLQPLSADTLGPYADRFHQFRGRSEDFQIQSDFVYDSIDGLGGASSSGERRSVVEAPPPCLDTPGPQSLTGSVCYDVNNPKEPTPSANIEHYSVCDRLSIVIACHSHAPLNEFWSRVPLPKIAVVMPCCANYSDLPDDTLLLTFEDFEVYSPKRQISLYASTFSPELL